MNKINDLVLLGATGSIGEQTITVCLNNDIVIKAIAFGKNIDKAIEVINQCKPKFVCAFSEKEALELKSRIKSNLKYLNIEIGFGEDGLKKAITYSNNIVNAITGISGLRPTIWSIESKKNLMLANKESLVVGGELINKLALENNVEIIPIDSEHNAIYRLVKNNKNEISKLIITASGGSFRNKTREELVNISVKDALNHPNWSMGKKITIDSATMANKGLEVIEAHYLFNIDYDKIETIIHPESIIHSMVEYNDNSVGAILYSPSMIIPIQDAILNKYEKTEVAKLDFGKIKTLNFTEMDFSRFPLLKLAYEVGRKGGLYPTVYNASNEAAVELFLEEKISFLDIEKIVTDAVREYDSRTVKSNMENDFTIEDIIKTDIEVKERIKEVYK